MLSIMLFLFLFFLGIVAMFYYFLRRVEQNARLLRDEHAQLRVLMRAMESHLDHMDRLETLRAREDGVDVDRVAHQETDNASGEGDPGSDPLLHLSFEEASKVDEAPNALNINFDPGQDNGWRKRDEA